MWYIVKHENIVWNFVNMKNVHYCKAVAERVYKVLIKLIAARFIHLYLIVLQFLNLRQWETVLA